MSRKDSWRLLVFGLTSKQTHQRLLVFIVPLAALVLLDQVFGFLGSQWQWFWLALLLSLLAWCYFALWLPRSRVSVEHNRLTLWAPFRKLVIPFADIASYKASRLEEHHTYDQLSSRELDQLGAIYQQPCMHVELEQSARLAKSGKPWMSKFLFTPDKKGLLLIVDDWMSLSKAFNGAFLKWRQRSQSTAQKAAPAPGVSTRAAAPGVETVSNPPPVREKSNMPSQATNGDHSTIEAISLTDAPIVLVIEDNQHMASQLQMLLEPHYRVMVARDGRQGLRQTLRLKPDLILSDIAIPDLDGLELLRIVRGEEATQFTPFVILTGDHELSSRIRALEAGANDFLTKPCDGQELLARVNNLLRQKAQIAALVEANQRLEERLEAQMAELMVTGDLQQFLPQTVAQRMREGEIAAIEESERRNVTVLFVDIVGFSPMTERLPPGKLANILNDYLQEMSSLAVLYGGTVDKFIGDGVMVLFGAPTPAPEADQAWAAIQTAMAMHYQMKQFTERWSVNATDGFRLRIGIHTGPCIVGVFGSDVLRSYTAVGVGVNTAARLQTQARSGETLISRETHRLIADKITVSSVGTMKLKGILEAIEAFEVRSIIQ